MKLNIYSVIIASAFFMMSCNATHNHNHEAEAAHTEEDGHNHEQEAKEEGHANEIVFTAKQAQAAGLKIETAKASSFNHVIKTSGQILIPQGEEQTIAATSSGIVSFANKSISDGIPVRLGETVVIISSKNLQEGDPVMKAKIAFELAEKEYKRAKALIAEKIISNKEFELISSRYETAKATYQGQAVNITSTGVRVTSPMTGYIKNRLVSQGDYVSVGQPIVTVVQNRRLQLRADVSENYFNQLRNISSANFKTAYDNRTYKLSEMNGKLLSYGKASDKDTSYIPVTFEFDNVGDVIPGSFTEVYLLASQRDNVISVPVTALTEEQGLNFVYLQIEPDAFMKQEVTVGQNNGVRAEIIKGLHGGEKVVTQGVIQVKLASASGAIPAGHQH